MVFFVVGIYVIDSALQGLLIKTISFVESFRPNPARQTGLAKRSLCRIFITADDRTYRHRDIIGDEMDVVGTHSQCKNLLTQPIGFFKDGFGGDCSMSFREPNRFFRKVLFIRIGNRLIGGIGFAILNEPSLIPLKPRPIRREGNHIPKSLRHNAIVQSNPPPANIYTKFSPLPYLARQFIAGCLLLFNGNLLPGAFYFLTAIHCRVPLIL